MTDHNVEPGPDEPHWTSDAAASDIGHRPRRRPMSELADFERTADDILARQAQHVPNPSPDLAVASLDYDTIWKNYRAGRGTPTRASTLTPAQTVDREEIERRLKR